MTRDVTSRSKPRLFLSAGLGLIVAVACAPTSDDSGAPRAAETTGVDVEIQGHRGARGLKPENTLPAFEVALDLLVPALELDVHLTADGHVVVWHDPNIEASKCDSTVAGQEPPPPISGLTLEEVARYRCDRNPDAGRFPSQDSQPTTLAGDNFGIVTLDQLFEFVDEYASSSLKSDDQRANAALVRFNIETKRVPDDPSAIGDDFDGTNVGVFELFILDAITRHDLLDRVTIQSFDHRSLWAMVAESPDISVSALSYRIVPHLATLVERGAEIWSPNGAFVDADIIDRAHAVGLRVIVWTVNDLDEMTRLIGLGVDGIITDRPDLAMSFAGG